MIAASSITVTAGPMVLSMLVPKSMPLIEIADWVEMATGYRATRIVVKGVTHLRRGPIVVNGVSHLLQGPQQ